MWQQFSITDLDSDSIDHEKAFQFLERFGERTSKFHFLFEPHLLVRIRGNTERAITIAQELAASLSLRFRLGDVGNTSPPGQWDDIAADWLGALSENFLEVVAELVLEIRRRDRREDRIRKLVHLMLCSFGMEYPEEAAFLDRCAALSRKLAAFTNEEIQAFCRSGELASLDNPPERSKDKLICPMCGKPIIPGRLHSVGEGQTCNPLAPDYVRTEKERIGG
jgi:hypothetical protein